MVEQTVCADLIGLGVPIMTGDAKLGLLLGVGVVVAAALAYYRPDALPPNDAETAVKAQAQNSSKPVHLSPMPKLGLPRE